MFINIGCNQQVTASYFLEDGFANYCKMAALILIVMPLGFVFHYLSPLSKNAQGLLGPTKRKRN